MDLKKTFEKVKRQTKKTFEKLKKTDTETRWLGGWQFLNGLYKQRWQAGCLLHQYVLRNTLVG